MGDHGPARARQELVELAARGVRWPRWPVPPAGLRPAAVLVLFGSLEPRTPGRRPATAPAGLDVLLVGRSTTLRHHPGQVAFPGGRLDPEDDGPVAAALREAAEETGLDRHGVEVLGTLGSLPVPVSRHRVTPVLAWWAAPTPVSVMDHGESATVFRAPVGDLLDPDRRVTTTLRHGIRAFSGPGFQLDGHLVWGFTAMVLDRLFDSLGWSEPWDRSRTVVPSVQPPGDEDSPGEVPWSTVVPP